MAKAQREEYPTHVQRAIDEAKQREASGTTRIGESVVFPGDMKPQIIMTSDAPRWKHCRIVEKPIALGTMVAPKFRSDLERRYVDEVLEPERLAGEILGWHYEAVTFNLGNGAKFKPDFLVLPNTRELTMVECKGFWREAARVRIKIAAAIFRFIRFKAVTRNKDGAWVEESFSG